MDNERDFFTVTLRVGDGTHTVGFAGRGRTSGHDITWTAAFNGEGLSITPQPVKAAKWDGEVWTYEDGDAIPAAPLTDLLDSLGRSLQAVVNGADAAAGRAYEAAIEAGFGAIPTQRILFL